VSAAAPGIAQTAALLARGNATVESLLRECLAQVGERGAVVKAWAHLDEEHALEQARLRDRALRRGASAGPLHGVPVGIKDIIDTAGVPTEYGCSVFAGRIPERDAWLVERLKRAGAIILGKTVTAEMATFGPGATTNPHDPARTPGGSSSGSAAAVAAGMIPGAVGTQTNGSMIRPASFCGVVGFKPTRGLVPRHGVLKQSPFLDQVGVFARCVVDAALLAEAIIGSHPDDPATSPARPRPPLARVCREEPATAPRFALVRTAAWERAAADTRRGMELLAADLGGQVFEAALPAGFESVWDWHRLVNEADIAAYYGPYFRDCMDRISETLQGQIRRGAEVRALDYLHAREQREHLNAQLDELFDRCDALITPAAVGEAPEGLESTGDPVFCTTWTLAGTPALSLPLLTGERGLPIGVQLVGRRHDDARLLRAARWLERRANGAGAGSG